MLLPAFLLLAINDGFGQYCPPKPTGWEIHVNPSDKKMEAKGFNIWIGGSQDRSAFWMTWTKGMPQNFPVPTYLLYAKEIWVKVQTLEDGKNFNLWTFYKDHTTKNWESDGTIDDETSQGDDGN